MAVLRDLESACLTRGGNCGHRNQSCKQCKRDENPHATLNHVIYIDTKSQKGL